LSGKTCFFPSFDPIFQDFQTKLSPDTPGGFNQRSGLSTMAGRSRAQYRYWVDFLGVGGCPLVWSQLWGNPHPPRIFFGMFKKTMGMGLSSGDATYQMTQAVPWGLSFPDMTFHHLWPVTFLF